MTPVKFSVIDILLFSCLAIAALADDHPVPTNTGAIYDHFGFENAMHATPTDGAQPTTSPHSYPKSNDAQCNDIGDCLSATVKWGHVAEYTKSAIDIRGYLPEVFFQNATVDARSTVGDRNPNQNVFLPYVFNGPPIVFIDATRHLRLNLTMNPGNSITWSDLATEWSILSAMGNSINQSTSGTIWSKDPNSVVIGSWFLDAVTNK